MQDRPSRRPGLLPSQSTSVCHTHCGENTPAEILPAQLHLDVAMEIVALDLLTGALLARCY